MYVFKRFGKYLRESDGSLCHASTSGSACDKATALGKIHGFPINVHRTERAPRFIADVSFEKVGEDDDET